VKRGGRPSKSVKGAVVSRLTLLGASDTSPSSRGVFNSGQGLEERRTRSALRVAAKVA
jgi:hypothetical protein